MNIENGYYNALIITIEVVLALCSCNSRGYHLIEHGGIHLVLPSETHVLDTTFKIDDEFYCLEKQISYILDSNNHFYSGDSLLLFELVTIDSNMCDSGRATKDVIKGHQLFMGISGLGNVRFSNDSTVGIYIDTSDAIYKYDYLNFEITHSAPPLTI